jgi:polysaccharide pyruvyl transferase WcaK-like protein
MSFYAKGRLRENALISPTVGFLCFPIIYFLFKFGYSPVSLSWVFLINHSILGLIIKPYLAVKIANYTVKPIIKMFFSCLMITVAAIPIPLILLYVLDDGVIKFMTVCSISVLCVFISAWLLGIDKSMRIRIISVIKTGYTEKVMTKSKTGKNILLIGIAGTYNYGCEAIIRGTVNILKNYNPDFTIYYASYNYKNDIERLAGCDIKIINRDRKGLRGVKWICKRLIRKLFALAGRSYILPYDSISWLAEKNIDTLFSIGGDIYTLSVGDTFINPMLAFFCDKCHHLGIKYILWGASVGPFDKNPEALAFYKKHLKKIDLIVSREYSTIKYLEKIGVSENVVYAPDPAFFANSVTDITKKKHPETIGINLSPLSSMYEYSSIKTGLNIQLKTILDILNKTPNNILLIPHVRSLNKFDNDLWYLKQLYELIPPEYKKRVELLENDPGFCGLKQELVQLSFVIAARMHCAINAITCHVPVIFLAYSEKAKGMSQVVYDSSNPVLSLSEFKNPEKIMSVMENWDYKSNFERIRKFNYTDILNTIFK